MYNIDFMLSLTKKKHWLKPHPGHTCMAITDDTGKILEDTHVSLRPTSKHAISGKSALHPGLYPAPLPGSMSIAKHTTIASEIELLAEKMLRDNSITADLTIILMGQTRVQLEDLLQNIQSARAIKLYNLFSLIVKMKAIEDITEKDIRSYVEELKKHADEFPALRDNADSETDSVLAALACTHAIAKAIFGDAYAVDRETLPDQDTQTAVVYCTIALIGTRNFLDFAHKINFFDAISNLTKKR